MKLRLLTILLALLPLSMAAQKSYELKDPTGKLVVNVKVGSELTYSVSHGGDLIIAESPISMTLTDGTVFGKDARLRKKTEKSVNQTINTVIYKKNQVVDNYNELRLDFKGSYSVIFRAYPDGAAYRFVSDLKEPFCVESEQAKFNFPDNPKMYAAFPKGREVAGKVNQYHSAFQATYNHVNISEWDKERLSFLPVLVERAGEKKVVITEADLMNYPGMFLVVPEDNSGLEGHFAAYPKDTEIAIRGLKQYVLTREDYIAKAEGKTNFPWRAIIVSENDGELLNSDMVYKLATPSEGDFSWVKPGKVAWDWWNDWNISGVDFRAGVNNDTYKYYIDFASKYGIEYVILDEGWAVAGPADLFQIVPEINLEELIAHADSKNVGLILWAGYRAFDKDMDNICKHYAAMGIKGFKIDFMDRDDQLMIDFNRRCAEVGAKYKLLIDLHGTSKPTGLQRTYPNCINFEGVFGLEELKWAKPETDMVEYDVTFPFIRMVAGPLDYTQGAMVNMNKENFRVIYTQPMSQGTRCRQLAEYVIFESPVNMMCDNPTNYLKEEECTKFIASLPTVWDETRPLQAKIGEYIVLARKNGNDWYVGALTDWTERDITIDLSFLPDGKYKAEFFRDGVNADRVASDYKREVVDLPANKQLKAHLAPGGGYIVRVTLVE